MVGGEAPVRGRGRPQDRQQRRLRGRREEGGGEARGQRQECSSDDSNIRPGCSTPIGRGPSRLCSDWLNLDVAEASSALVCQNDTFLGAFLASSCVFMA